MEGLTRVPVAVRVIKDFIRPAIGRIVQFYRADIAGVSNEDGGHVQVSELKRVEPVLVSQTWACIGTVLLRAKVLTMAMSVLRD